MMSATESQRKLFTAAANPMKTDFQQQQQRPRRSGPTPFFSEHLKGRLSGGREAGRSRGSRGGSSRRSSRGGSSRRSSDGGSSRDGSSCDESRREGLSAAASEAADFFGGLSSERDEEKQNMLFELRRMKMTHPGLSLTREYTMSDKHEDIEYEFKRQTLALETKGNVDFMKDMLKLGCSGIELASSKMRILSLDGWSDAACSDMDRYTGPLERCYRKVWRKGGSVNPFLELAFALISSIAMFHFKSRMGLPTGGGGGGGRNAPGGGGGGTVPFNLGPFNFGGAPARKQQPVSGGGAPPQDHNIPAAGATMMKPPGVAPNPLAAVAGGGANPLTGINAAGALLGTAFGGGGGGGGPPQPQPTMPPSSGGCRPAAAAAATHEHLAARGTGAAADPARGEVATAAARDARGDALGGARSGRGAGRQGPRRQGRARRPKSRRRRHRGDGRALLRRRGLDQRGRE